MRDERRERLFGERENDDVGLSSGSERSLLLGDESGGREGWN